MTIDHSFIQSGQSWTSQEISALEFNFASQTPTLWYFNVAFQNAFENGDTGLEFSGFSNPSSYDQKDVARYLLLDSVEIQALSGSDTVNTNLATTVNTQIAPSVYENYRVSFAEVITADFSEDTAGEIQLFNHQGLSQTSGSLAGLAGGSSSLAGDVIINYLDPNYDEVKPGEFGFWVILHELGHAVGGLQDYGAQTEAGTYLNNQKYSMMSYNPYGVLDGSQLADAGTEVYASGLQLLDIAALQDTYNTTNTSTRSGDTIYALGQGLGVSGSSADDAFLYTIWDGSGNDTIDASLFNVRAEIDLREGYFSSIGKDRAGNAWNFDVDADTVYDPDPGNVAIAYGTEIENAIGTDHNDHIIGNDLGNTITGGEGNDTLEGGAGADVYVYNQGDGHDTITDDWTEQNEISFGSGINQSALSYDEDGNDLVIALDASNSIRLENFLTTSSSEVGFDFDGTYNSSLLFGSNSFDVLIGDSGNNSVYGLGGNDYLYGYEGSDSLFGGAGDDYLDDYIDAEGETSIISGGDGDDFIKLGSTLQNYSGTAEIDGGIGDDEFLIGGGLGMASTVTDSSGSEFYNLEKSQSISITDTGAGDDQYQTNALADDVTVLDDGGFDQFYHRTSDLSSVSVTQVGNDLRIVANNNDLTIFKNYFGDSQYKIEEIRFKNTEYFATDLLTTGVNLVTGTNSLNFLTGTNSDDTIIALAGNDFLSGLDGNDTLDGGSGNDNLAGGAGNDTLNGGSGSDTADYSSNTAAVNVELNNDQTDEGRDSSWDDDLTSIENVIGTSYADRFIGDGEGNTVHAGDGADMAYGGVGSDTLHGEDGNDALYGEHGDDVLYGGAGADTLDGDRYNLSANDSGNDTIYGGDGADNIWGRHGDDVLHGEDGNDIMRGNEGNDTLFGGAGNDKLYGHDGDDILWGGLDHDDLWGGAGADTFAFANTLTFDEIHDFSLSEGDKLDISTIVTGFDPGTSVLTDFFKIGFNGTHSYAHVDSDGGADGFDQIIKFVSTEIDETDFTVGVNLII